jgi:endonuclease/exonuclease/phosphatase family metal-dependent hydrolase
VLCKGQGGEAAAFLWRRPVSLQGEPKPLEERERSFDDNGPNFKRTPSFALFSAGKTDFYVVTCHLTDALAEGRNKGQAEEYAALADWLRKLEGREEKNAVVMGTFNRFVSGKAPWGNLWSAAEEGHFRFPILDAIRAADKKFDPSQDEAPEPRYSTTVGRKATLRDQIVLSRGLTTEFRAAAPKLGEDVGIVDFDNDDQYRWAVGSWSDAATMLSDHRPIWVRLAIEPAK